MTSKPSKQIGYPISWSHIGSGSFLISSKIFLTFTLLFKVNPFVIGVHLLFWWRIRYLGHEPPASVNKVVECHSSTE